MELTLKLHSDQVGLILAQAKSTLRQGGMIYYGYRQMLNSICQQLPKESAKEFRESFPLLTGVLCI